MASVLTDWQNRILLEVGAGTDTDMADVLTTSIAALWDAWAVKGLIYPYLQYLYVKRQACDILMGQLRNLTNATVTELSPRQGERFQNIKAIRDAAQLEIVRLEKQARANRAPVVFPLIQRAPWNRPLPDNTLLPSGFQVPPNQVPPYGADPNNPAYIGDPKERNGIIYPG